MLFSYSDGNIKDDIARDIAIAALVFAILALCTTSYLIYVLKYAGNSQQVIGSDGKWTKNVQTASTNPMNASKLEIKPSTENPNALAAST